MRVETRQPILPIMKQSIFLLCMIFLLGFTNKTKAQGKFGVFVGAGAMGYSGDLQDSFISHPLTIRWSANAGFIWQLNRRWGLHVNYTVGRLVGTDALSVSVGKRARDFRFKTFVHEIGLHGTYDILRNDKWKFLPYITAGVSAINFNPKRDGTALRPLATEGVAYSAWNVSFPIGLGLRYQLNCRWTIKAEAAYRFTLTDYLDDVSGAYPDADAQVAGFSDPGGVSPPRQMRGNPKLKDCFWDVNIGIIFFFKGCGKGGKKGGLIEDCDQLYKGVDIDKLMKQYGR